jgi:hypothetical protein
MCIDFDCRRLESNCHPPQNQPTENQRLSSYFSGMNDRVFRYNSHEIDTSPHVKEHRHLESGFCSLL